MQFPGVKDALVVALPHRMYGLRPAAFVKYRGHELPIDAMARFLARRLPKYKIPDRFFPWPISGQMPESATMKNRRADFAEIARKMSN